MTIDFCFYTDGDFCLDKEYFDKQLKSYCYDCSNNYTYYKDFECWGVRFDIKFKEEPKDKVLREQMLARDFTEALVKSVRFSHIFLMRRLYELSEKVTHWAFHEMDKQTFHEFWSGNYDGTELVITR